MDVVDFVIAWKSTVSGLGEMAVIIWIVVVFAAVTGVLLLCSLVTYKVSIYLGK
jgi:hypothetical protein